MEKEYPIESDARSAQPSFDEMVELIKKLFTDYLEDVMKSPPPEIDKAWERYRVLNHLYQDNEDMMAWEKEQKTLTPFEETILEQTFQRSLKDKPSSFYQPLFDHMLQEHGLTLLESRMADIIHVVEEMQVGVKLTPEQIEERRKAIEWYRNPDKS